MEQVGSALPGLVIYLSIGAVAAIAAAIVALLRYRSKGQK